MDFFEGTSRRSHERGGACTPAVAAPPARGFDLVVEWPAIGIGLTRVQIDGAAVNDAVARVEPMVDRD